MISREGFGSPLILSPDAPRIEVNVVRRGRFVFISAGAPDDNDAPVNPDSKEYRAALAEFER